MQRTWQIKTFVKKKIYKTGINGHYVILWAEGHLWDFQLMLMLKIWILSSKIKTKTQCLLNTLIQYCNWKVIASETIPKKRNFKEEMLSFSTDDLLPSWETTRLRSEFLAKSQDMKSIYKIHYISIYEE